MPIQPLEVTFLGYELAERMDSEAALRAAVGRIYYGLFLLCREVFNVRARRRDAHDVVAQEVTRGTKSATGTKFRRLMQLREFADYEPQEPGWADKVIRAKGLCEDVFEDLRARGRIERSLRLPQSG